MVGAQRDHFGGEAPNSESRWSSAIRLIAKQASNGVTIEVQRRTFKRVAESNGWDLTWLSDEGVSGPCLQSPTARTARIFLAIIRPQYARRRTRTRTPPQRADRVLRNFSQRPAEQSGRFWAAGSVRDRSSSPSRRG